jgi:predicted N-acyltransferase
MLLVRNEQEMISTATLRGLSRADLPFHKDDGLFTGGDRLCALPPGGNLLRGERRSGTMKDSERTVDLEAHVHRHINEIPKEEWDTLVNHKLFHTYRWMELLEYSLREGISPYYITITRDNDLVGGAVCYPSYRLVFKFYLQSMVCLCPFSDDIGLYIKSGEPAEAIFSLLFSHIEEAARKERARIVVINNVDVSPYRTLLQKKAALIKMSPSTCLDVQWKTFKDYLRSLPRKSKKNIRHTLNQGERRGLRLEHSQDFSDAEFLFRFYEENLRKHGHSYPLPITSQFYTGLGKYVGDFAYILRCYHGSKLLGYWIYFFDGSIASMAISGSEEDDAREYNAYFNICYDAVREMIEKGCSKIYFGPTTYTVKRRIGCTLLKKEVSMKFLNPVLNAVLRLLAPLWNVWMRRAYSPDTTAGEPGE